MHYIYHCWREYDVAEIGGGHPAGTKSSRPSGKLLGWGTEAGVKEKRTNVSKKVTGIIDFDEVKIDTCSNETKESGRVNGKRVLTNLKMWRIRPGG